MGREGGASTQSKLPDYGVSLIKREHKEGRKGKSAHVKSERESEVVLPAALSFSMLGRNLSFPKKRRRGSRERESFGKRGEKKRGGDLLLHHRKDISLPS